MSLITPPPVILNKEQEEEGKKREEKVEACLHTIIKVARDEDLAEQIGKEIYFDLVNHDKVCTFRIKEQMPFTQFKEEVAKELGIPVQFQRFWLWGERQNLTYRPYRALTAQDEIQSVGLLRKISNRIKSSELKLFLEVELCLDLRPTIKDEILLFFKLYDPLAEKIRYVGRLFVKGCGKPLEIFSKLKEFAGFSPNEEIELFEELKFEPNVMCEKVDSMLSFRESQLEDGDIICFQKSLQNQCSKLYRFPEVPSFLEYVHNRQMRLKKEQEEKEQKGKRKAEAGLYTMIKVARDEDLGEQIVKEIYFDLVDHDKVRTFCIPKQMPFIQFKAKRQNHTYRPDRALTAQEEFQSVNELRVISNNGNDADLKLYLEVELCLDLRPAPPGKSKEEILLFFKLYDPLKENISEQYRFPKVPSFLEYVHNRQPKEHEMPGPSSRSPTKIHQSSEVAPLDAASKVDDPASSRFTWTIDQFSKLKVKKYSDAFNVGGSKWRILMFPRGNKTPKGNKTDHLSIYLDVVDPAALPSGWSRYANFSLAVLDQVHGKFTVRKETEHHFNASESDWGYTTFLPLTELKDPGRGYLVDDKIILEADISICSLVIDY